MTVTLALLHLVLIVPKVLWGAFVFCTLWAWFAVAQFGLASINIPQAIGISLLVGALTWGIPRRNEMFLLLNPEKTKDDKIIAAILEGFTYPAMALGIGWVVKQFL